MPPPRLLRYLSLALVLLAVACSRSQPAASSSYLFVWAGDADKKSSDFLGVIDASPESPRYGAIVASIPVGEIGTSPHHTEQEMPGGLVHMNERGDVIRAVRARDDAISYRDVYPYHVLPMPALDRAVSSTTDMNDKNLPATSEWVQIWRLSDLTLLKSFALPPGRAVTSTSSPVSCACWRMVGAYTSARSIAVCTSCAISISLSHARRS